MKLEGSPGQRFSKYSAESVSRFSILKSDSLWEPLAVTFHFLGEEFSLKGAREGNKILQKERGPVGCFPKLVPTFPRVSISISLCFLGFFQMLTSDIPREATLGER